MSKLKQSLFALSFIGLMALLLPGWAQAADEDKYAVRITSEQLIFVPVKGNLQVIQSVTVANNGTITEPRLTFPLPEGAGQTKLVDGGETIRINASELVDSQPLKPGGSRSLSWSYQLPLAEKSAVMTLTQAYKADTIQVYVPAGYLSMQAENFLTQSQVVTIGGQKFRKFTRFDLYPDTPWHLSFRQLDPDSGEQYTKVQTVTHDGLPIIGHHHGMDTGKALISLTMVVLILLFGFIGVRNANRRTASQLKHYAKRDLERRRDELQDKLTRLHREQRQGKLSEEEFEPAREQLETELISIYYMLKTSEQTL
jgi:hypothetical protein